MDGRAWALAAAVALTACGGDDDDAPVGCPDASIDTTTCTTVLRSDTATQQEVQRALIEAQSGSDVCFCPGNYSFDKELSLTVPDVTVRGVGASRADTVLDFAAQTVGDDGFTVTSDGFTIENLSLKNTPGNGIVVTGAADVTFRNIAVSWDAGSVVENGAYAVYPVKSSRVIVEDSEVVGAADAGIYVGQCEDAIVRNNVVYGNVAGIEIENSSGADVYGNESYDNTAGILVFVLPNLEKKDGTRCKVHDNVVRENNRPNFAEPGTIVAEVPQGLGLLVLAADDTEITGNTISDNQSTGIFIVSFSTLGILLPDVMPDPGTDPDPEKIFIHDNTFEGNGTDPQGAAGFLTVSPLEDVVWDGVEKGMTPNASAELCFGDAPPSFRDFGGAENIGDPTMHSTDTAVHECTLPELPSLSW